MQLAFETRELRTICENEVQAVRELGPEVAQSLKRRLADLDAATSIEDILVGNPRTLDAEHSHCMAIDLCNGYFVVFCPNHATNPVTATGVPDWKRTSRIRLLRIEGNRGQ